MKFNELNFDLIGKEVILISRPKNNKLQKYYENQHPLVIFDLTRNFHDNNVCLMDENFNKYWVKHSEVKLYDKGD